MIKVNMEKAIVIKQNAIRQERESKLKALDVEFLMALEEGNTEKTKEIVAKKQLLRDATEHPSIINATTPEELKSADPLAEVEELKSADPLAEIQI